MLTVSFLSAFLLMVEDDGVREERRRVGFVPRCSDL